MNCVRCIMCNKYSSNRGAILHGRIGQYRVCPECLRKKGRRRYYPVDESLSLRAKRKRQTQLRKASIQRELDIRLNDYF